ncbi:MAG: hypothetical protein U0835_24365 [Isosphaeraceae bacterium]
MNHLRLQVLKDPNSGGWIDLEELLTRDALFNDERREQQAYAQAWVLVYEHMKNNQRATKLRAIRPPADPPRRQEPRGGRETAARRPEEARPRPEKGRPAAAVSAGRDGVAQPRTGFSPMFRRISARCFS